MVRRLLPALALALALGSLAHALGLSGIPAAGALGPAAILCLAVWAVL